MTPQSSSLNTIDCGPLCQKGHIHNQVQQAGILDQASDFFKGLFSTTDWPARWNCGTWSDFHGWLYIVSDLLIWAAYFLIPIFLIRLVLLRKDFPFPKVIWLFGAFIVLCGLTHFIDAIIFWIPVYRLSAFVRFVTAIVSLVTVYGLYRILPNVLLLRSVKELEHEINERRVVEEKLAESEFLLSEAGHVGRVGGWELDVASNRFYWSKTAKEIYEADPEETALMEATTEFFIEPHQEIVNQEMQHVYEHGEGWDKELQMITARKNRKWVRYYGKPLYDQNGNLIKMRGVLMDIDKYKINELDLSKSVELMARQNSQLKNFTHILSHNLRNHASNIFLLSSLVDDTKLDTENAEIFRKIKNVSDNLSATLDDLSQIIKVRESNLSSEMLSFREMTKKVLEILNFALNESNAVVDLHFEVDTIWFPSIYLESIIMNLVSNGIKYRKPDTNLHITLKTYVDHNQMKTLQYCDNGIGIDLALHGDKIFGLYKTFHKHKDAHGVGLFLVKNQIESQGGKIQVESKPNEGTTFRITFNEKN